MLAILFFFTRSGDSDLDQLAYSETRCTCLRNLEYQIDVDGIPIKDVMRFCKGDGPSLEFECGNQRGGYLYCPGCKIHASRTYELDHAFRCPHTTLQERQQAVLKGRIGFRRSLDLHPKPLANLRKEDLKTEVIGRGLEVDGDKKEDYQKALTTELAGQCRVPALLYHEPSTPLEDLGLSKYEILSCEPMHDLSNHITNLLEELPNHVTEDVASVLQECKDLTLGQKEKRAFDFRCLIITISSQLRGKAPLKVQQLIDTLVQMAEILFKPEKDRCPRLILRYHNLSFYHAILCLEVIGTQPTKLTRRKFYGKYYHGLVRHAPIQLRIISGESSNAEDEERFFNSIKSITRETSSQHPSHIIGNIIIRLQAEHAFKQQFCTSRADQDSCVKKLAKSLPDFPDTLFQPFVLQKYKKQWQAHLEKISDFLLSGEGIWWEHDGENVIFHDSKQHQKASPCEPVLHHFRTSSLKGEECYLNQCWLECVERGISLPTHWLYLPDQENPDIVRKVATGFLSENKKANMQNTSRRQEESDENVEEQFDSGQDDNDDGDVDDDHENEVLISVNVTSTDEDIQLQDEENNTLDDIISKGDGETYKHHLSTKGVTEAIQITTQSETEIHPSSTLLENQEQPLLDSDITAGTCRLNKKDNQKAENHSLQTKLGKAVETVLGCTKEVEQFDKLRSRLKSNKGNNFLYEKYMNELASIQTKVLNKHNSLKVELKDWEKVYFIENNFKSPTVSDVMRSSKGSKILKTMQYTKALLKEWKIQLD